jgi:hypothetical protein
MQMMARLLPRNGTSRVRTAAALILSAHAMLTGCDQEPTCGSGVSGSGGGTTDLSATASGGASTGTQPTSGGVTSGMGSTLELGAGGLRITLPSEPNVPSVAAADLGAGYRFVLADLVGDLLLVAEGGGLPVIVSIQGCDAVDHITVVSENSDWHVLALTVGDAKWPYVVACDASRCALFGAESTTHPKALVTIPGSDIERGEWSTARNESEYDGWTLLQRRICLYGTSTRRCFGSGGWEAEERLPVTPPPHRRETPACEAVELVLYRDGFGVTGDGRVVQVENSTSAARHCSVVSEPLGEAIALVDYTCGISSNLWLVTDRLVHRTVNSSGCACYTD